MKSVKFQYKVEVYLIIFLFLTFIHSLEYPFLSEVNALDKKGKTEKELQEIKVGELAPLFALRNLDGSYVYLKDYCDVEDTKVPLLLRKEKCIVLVDFFSTICIPCIEELPMLHRIYDKYKDKGLKIFLISIDPKPEQVLPPFIKEHNITIPILLDMYQKTLKNYGFDSVPRTILIDKNRKILAVFKEEKDIEKKLDEKLNQLF